MDPALDRLVDAVVVGSVELADTLLRDGSVCPPTVHVLCKHLAQPYLGSITARPFRRGPDAASAVAELGLLPSAVAATRLVVVWEFGDLSSALGPSDRQVGVWPRGLVVVDADLCEHVVRWHPFVLRTPDPSRIQPEWGPVVRHPAGWLPVPVVELLATWRELRRRDVAVTRAELEAAGLLITLTTGSTSSRPGGVVSKRSSK